MAEVGRIGASHVGKHVARGTSATRDCARCGTTRQTNSRMDWTKPYLCGDCKSVDPQFGSRTRR